MPRETKEKRERSELATLTADVSDEALAGVIELARLDPLAPGMSHQKVHLKKILEHFQVLSSVQLEGLDPTIQINSTPIPLRPDEIGESLDKVVALSNARHKAGDFFLAPKILGGEQEGEA
jgi:aspartyl/glutamyl-tRNA(Asn/Gln) amidotransferase C subunit